MKSQPEIKIRRLAVFGGYGDLEAETAWSRHAQPHPRPLAVSEERPEITVIALDGTRRTADLPVAA